MSRLDEMSQRNCCDHGGRCTFFLDGRVLVLENRERNKLVSVWAGDHGTFAVQKLHTGGVPVWVEGERLEDTIDLIFEPEP